jgi:hypothetical protein
MCSTTDSRQLVPFFLTQNCVTECDISFVLLLLCLLGTCRQLVGSFIQTQKFSVHRTLERRFRSFLTHSSDYLQLVMTLLRQLLHEKQRDARLMGEAPTTYSIPLKYVHSAVQHNGWGSLSGFTGNLIRSATREVHPIHAPYHQENL